MVIETFTNDLVSELQELFSELKLKSIDDGYKKLSIYKQALPIPADEDPEPFPYIVVRTVDGGTTSPSKSEVVRVALMIGIFDDDTKNQGYSDLLNIIEKIKNHFEKFPILKSMYSRLTSEEYPLKWTLSEEDTYPYFFAGIEMSFAMPKVIREDLYSYE
jgi:hypothetical protein